MIPEIGAAEFVIPIRTPENLGAMSKWLTRKEAALRLEAPRASENITTARLVELQPT